jgi:hypothetical protein
MEKKKRKPRQRYPLTKTRQKAIHEAVDFIFENEGTLLLFGRLPEGGMFFYPMGSIKYLTKFQRYINKELDKLINPSDL